MIQKYKSKFFISHNVAFPLVICQLRSPVSVAVKIKWVNGMQNTQNNVPQKVIMLCKTISITMLII